MKLYIYTDGTTFQDIGVASSVILTDDVFVCNDTKKYTVETACETELLGIYQALEYVDKNKLYSEEIIVYTDAESLVVTYDKIKNLHMIPRKTKYSKIWKKVLNICKRHSIKFIYIQSHQDEHNPNKMCDMLGRAVRRCGMDMSAQG